ncbi:MAG: hypothetical protein ACOYXU_01945 [Nitrospirota bacterium]
MSKDFEGIVDEIRFLRWSLIPPYCENLDEDEKSSSEYAHYYASNLERGIESSRKYLRAIESLAESPDIDSFKSVFCARSEFIGSFPFCEDELIGIGTEELQPYLDFMAGTYRQESSNGGLQRNIARYIELLEKIVVSAVGEPHS